MPWVVMWGAAALLTILGVLTRDDDSWTLLFAILLDAVIAVWWIEQDGAAGPRKADAERDCTRLHTQTHQRVKPPISRHRSLLSSASMAPVPTVCPKCQRVIEAYEVHTLQGVTQTDFQKCPACGHEWAETFQRYDRVEQDQRPPRTRRKA